MHTLNLHPEEVIHFLKCGLWNVTLTVADV